jgi:hypothetical protein
MPVPEVRPYSYVGLAMAIGKSALRAIRKALTPPGNRGSLEDSYRQPNGEGTHVNSETSAAETAHGFTL